MSDPTANIVATINGRTHSASVEPRLTLADFLRERLGLTGTHLGCEHGVCGACTVLVDGSAIRSCILFAVQVDGCVVETVEGLDDGGRLSPIQEAFKTNQGFQCGFCTPGIIMMATELLREGGPLTREQVRQEMSGNLCRCTGYQGVIDAIVAAAAARDITPSRDSETAS